ncbi:MAG: Rpn family recombination-promoting nuclease/putative transposase [Clostridiales bacterium]|jgi:hypothetical protein|nr:Rpn family recombination-promoting nuclease/putative transposase [Clostridiales bacterium]
MARENLTNQPKDTMFRGIFIDVENFLDLLKRCRNGNLDLSAEELTPFDLNTEYAIRKRRNDVSFITKDNKLIILVEQQSTISANMAFKMLLYYFEIIQLWIKRKNIKIHTGTAISRDNAFIKAREDCIKAGYLKGFIEKEDTIIMYNDIFDYDTQLKEEAWEEGMEKGVQRILELIKKGLSPEEAGRQVLSGA